MVDVRKQIGAAVQTMATNVLSGPECSRRYGPHYKRKKLNGTVTAFTNDVNPRTNRRQGKVTALFQYGSNSTRSCTLLLSQVLVPQTVEVNPPEENPEVAVPPMVIDVPTINYPKLWNPKLQTHR